MQTVDWKRNMETVNWVQDIKTANWEREMETVNLFPMGQPTNEFTTNQIPFQNHTNLEYSEQNYMNSCSGRIRSSTWPTKQIDSFQSEELQNDELNNYDNDNKPDINSIGNSIIDSQLANTYGSPQRSPIETQIGQINCVSTELPHQLSPSTQHSNQHQTDQQQLPTTPASSTSSHKSKNKNIWGDMSYADLISKAIMSSQNQRMTLAEIYNWIVENVSYFADKKDTSSTSGWKNSIRHNLSLHNKFRRIPNDTSGKSSWWVISHEKTGTKTRRSQSTTANTTSPRELTPKLSRKDRENLSIKETPTSLKKIKRKKGRRGSEGAISPTKIESPTPRVAIKSELNDFRSTSTDTVCSGDSRSGTPLGSPILGTRSPSLSNWGPNSPRLQPKMNTWHPSEGVFFPQNANIQGSRNRSNSQPVTTKLMQAFSPNPAHTQSRRLSERQNCAQNSSVTSGSSPDSISDINNQQILQHGQAPWTSPIESPPPQINNFHHSSVQHLHISGIPRTRSASFTNNLTSQPLLGISESPGYTNSQQNIRDRSNSFTTRQNHSKLEMLQNLHIQKQHQINFDSATDLSLTLATVNISMNSHHTRSQDFQNLVSIHNQEMQMNNRGGYMPSVQMSGNCPHIQPPSYQLVTGQRAHIPESFCTTNEDLQILSMETHPQVTNLRRDCNIVEKPNTAQCYQLNTKANSFNNSPIMKHNENNLPRHIMHSSSNNHNMYLIQENMHNKSVPGQTKNVPNFDLKSLEPSMDFRSVDLRPLSGDDNFDMLDLTVPIKKEI